jgi:hypothetical protein
MGEVRLRRTREERVFARDRPEPARPVIPLDRLIASPSSVRVLRAADSATARASLLHLQRFAGSAAVQRLAQMPVQRDDEPATPPSGTNGLPDMAPKSIPYNQLRTWGVKPHEELKVEPEVETEGKQQGAETTVTLSVSDFWRGTLGSMPTWLRNFRLVPKLGAGVEIETTDDGTVHGVSPKVGAKLFELPFRGAFKGFDLSGDINSNLKDTYGASAGIKWKYKPLNVEVEGAGTLDLMIPGKGSGDPLKLNPGGTIWFRWYWDDFGKKH